MNIDVVIPNGNEKQLISTAKNLGFDGLIILYEKPPKEINEKNFIIIPAELSEKHIAKRKGILFSRGHENTRWIFEKLKPSAVFNLELGMEKDRMSHRSSNLDQVLCKIAKRNKIKIGFNVSMMIYGDKKILGRVIQNIRLCQKYDNDCFFASFARNPNEMRACHDMKALALALGMSTEFIKKTFSVLDIMNNKKS